MWLAGGVATILAATLLGPIDGPAQAAAGCVVPGDDALRQGATLTPGGYYSYQEWVASEPAQGAVEAVGDVTIASFGPIDKANPDTQLARGYIGTAIDHTSQRLVVVVDPALVDVAAAEQRFAAASGATVRTAVQAGCFSAAALLAAGDLIWARAWHPRAASVTFAGYLDPADSRWALTFWPEDADVAGVLQARLGDRVRVEYGTPSRAGRDDDLNPHWGGAGIRRRGSPHSHECTSGFTVRLANGAYGTTTAGHCFGNGTVIDSGNYFGTVGGKSNYPMFDMAWVASWNANWYGPRFLSNPDRTYRTVTGAAWASVGMNVCQSGATSLAICGITVTSLGGKLCDPDGCTYSLLVARRAGTTTHRDGDSGAPIYTRPSSGGAATIRAMLIGGSTRDTMMGEHWSSIRLHLDVDIVRG